MKKLLLFYILMGIHGDLHLYSVKPDYALKVVTFNILFRGGDHHKTLHALQQSKADVLLLQEVTGTWEQELRQGLKAFRHQYYNSRRGNHGLAVLSKYPLSDLAYINNVYKRPIAQCFVVKAEQELFTCNVHLASPSSMLQKNKISIGEYMKTHQLRTVQWGTIVRYLNDHARQRPVILAGDFNTLPIELLYHTITRGFVDAWDRNFGYGATFPNRNPSLAPVARIDYVFVRHALPLTEEVLPESGSDHLGLKAEVGYWRRQAR